MTIVEKNCESCKHKETSGLMVHPCFPCLSQSDVLGNRIEPFSYWTDEKLTWDEIEELREHEQQEFNSWVEGTPEIKKLFDDLCDHIRNGWSKKQ